MDPLAWMREIKHKSTWEFYLYHNLFSGTVQCNRAWRQTETLNLQATLLRFAVEVQVFHCVQIPLQFHCIFYRQTMQILNVKTAKKYLQWVVCKKCSETAVGFVPQWKPVVFAVKILAVYGWPPIWCMNVCVIAKTNGRQSKVNEPLPTNLQITGVSSLLLVVCSYSQSG